jgi:hypothetical protein
LKKNKIENIEAFALSFKSFNRLKHLELYINWNLLRKLPAFLINNDNSGNVMDTLIMNFSDNRIENMEEFGL